MVVSACSSTCRLSLARARGWNAIAPTRLFRSSPPRSFHHLSAPLLLSSRMQNETLTMVFRCAFSSSTSPPQTEQNLIRLSKRMGELDMFSRREADRLILDGKVFVDGSKVEVGHKVPSDLSAGRIQVTKDDSPSSPQALNRNNHSESIRRATNRMVALVLNKPRGYVSGQAEHGHPPAIRLLTPRNRNWGKEDDRDDDSGISGSFDRRGLAPAGRLDLDSTGILVFTKHGVLAKKLIGEGSSVEKEYIATVEPAAKPTKKERSIDPSFVLPSKKHDLSAILQGGSLLLGDDRPLRACPNAEWIVKGKTLRIVLTEGRKHQIRRMCRELLGYHVVELKRVRIGPIVLPSPQKTSFQKASEIDDGDESVLREGCWRPIRQHELEVLLPPNL